MKPPIAPPETYNQFKSINLFALVCEKLREAHPPDRLGHLGLTFTGGKHDPKAMNRRYQSVASVVRSVFTDYVKVVEKHSDGTVHFHIIGALRSAHPTIQHAVNYMVGRGLKWLDNPKLKVPGKRKLRGYRGIGMFFLSPVDTIDGLCLYLSKQMREMVSRKVPGWARAKLWVASKRLRVNWRMAMHGPSFERAMQLMVTEHGLKSADELKQKLGRHWSMDVLQRKWEEELRAVLGEDRYATMEDRLVRKLRIVMRYTNKQIEALRKKARAWKQWRLIEMYDYRDAIIKTEKKLKAISALQDYGHDEARRKAIAKANPSPKPSMKDRFKSTPISRKNL